MSPIVIALTVVAFGTSLPELVVVLQASFTGYPGLVLGNVVGSNIANVLLVAGTGAVVCPLTYGEGSVRRDSLVMIGATVLLIVLCLDGVLLPIAGLPLLGGLVLVTLVTARKATRAYRAADLRTPMEWVLGLPATVWTTLLFIVVGAVSLPLGARLVVEATVEIAGHLGVSETETLVGLTILAFSTSLPELATTVVAALQKRTELAVGTVIGSNIFNILAIMGVAAATSPSPFPVPRSFLVLDFPVLLGSAILLSVFVWRRRPVGRSAGMLMVLGYAAYILGLVVRS